MSILIKDVFHEGGKTNIFIEGNLITELGDSVGSKSDSVIDGRNKAAVPGFVNAHTHAAMTLLRGYADDLELHDWLTNHIWPLEAKLTEEDVYWGARLACLEMIKTGTTSFNEMYWHPLATARAVEEMGLRGVISAIFVDLQDDEKSEEQINEAERIIPKLKKEFSTRVQPALGPHAVNTVSENSLEWCADFSRENELRVNIHLGETRKDNEEFIKKTGKRPIQYLEGIGLLNERLVAAHAIWVTKGEINLLAKNDVNVAHNPTSNMKLATGGVMPYAEMIAAGLTVSLGTDGCASNNNLDMLEAMKFASLQQKAHRWDQTVLPAKEALLLATMNGAKTLGINAGEIAVGKLADIALIDLKRPELTPHYNIASDLVYSANGCCVYTLICDGKVLMDGRVVEGEDEILEKAGETGRRLADLKS